MVFLDNWIKRMKIELATIQDVPALLDLQRKVFGPLCEELDWKDAPVLTETLEHACEFFYRMKFVLKGLSNSGCPSSLTLSLRIIQAMLRASVRIVCIPSSSWATCPGV